MNGMAVLCQEDTKSSCRTKDEGKGPSGVALKEELSKRLLICSTQRRIAVSKALAENHSGKSSFQRNIKGPG
jgi:hypothetical protein